MAALDYWWGVSDSNWPCLSFSQGCSQYTNSPLLVGENGVAPYLIASQTIVLLLHYSPSLLRGCIGIWTRMYGLKVHRTTWLCYTSATGRHTMSWTWATALSELCATTTLYAFFCYWWAMAELNCRWGLIKLPMLPLHQSPNGGEWMNRTLSTWVRVMGDTITLIPHFLIFIHL